jgi:hypothetical protein
MRANRRSEEMDSGRIRELAFPVDDDTQSAAYVCSDLADEAQSLLENLDAGFLCRGSHLSIECSERQSAPPG